MRGRLEGQNPQANWAHVPDVQMREGMVGMPLGMEYDGLDSGELAWILGGNGGKGGEGSYLTRTAHSGMGFGVDRMQRLASQFYVENYFRAMFGGKVINLATLPIVSEFSKTTSSEIAMYQQYLTGASVLGSVDLPHLVNGLFRGAVPADQLQYSNATDASPVSLPAQPVRGAGPKEGFASGLFVLEKGPFLRGKIVQDEAMYMVAPEIKKHLVDGHRKHSVARNLGDRLAFDALYAAMKQQGMFDWTPDGLVLSKLESPSGDPLSSAEIDARQAQLFNVAIQGPAITKTWTGNPALHAMPLDKVFVVIVADISSEVDVDPANATKGVGAVANMDELWNAYKTIYTDLSASKSANITAYNDKLAEVDAEFTTATQGVKQGAYADAVQALFKASKDVAVDTTNNADLKTVLETAKATLRTYTETMITFDGNGEFDEVAAKLKQGTIGIASSSMTNFRLMRVTSSFLINNSAAKVDASTGKLAPSSRCGLKLGKNGNTYTGEYIIGGWCVGTVLDSAASRSVTGNQVRTAPGSMAMNINVGVEWMSGDDLYRRYMDVDGTVQQRGVSVSAKPPADTAPRDTLAARQVGLDVNPAAQLETKSVQEY
jgi:hypothetical protein